MIETGPRGPEQLVILKSFKAGSLDHVVDSFLSRHEVYPHSPRVGDQIMPGTQGQVIAPGLRIRGWIEILVGRGRLYLDVLIAGDVTLENVTVPWVPAFLVAVKATL